MTSLTQRARLGALYGSLVGLCFFLADLGGAFLAIGWLFDPTLDSWLFVLVAGIVQTLCAAVSVVLVSALWPGFSRAIRRWHRPLLGLIAIAALAIGYGGRRSRNLQVPPGPSVVRALRPVPILWLMIDTLRADVFFGTSAGSHGVPDFPLTPRLAQFARRSNVVVMTDVESAAGWTIPSVATLMTGLHPVTLYSARHLIPQWAPTAAERLLEAGYRTHAVVDNALLEQRNGFAQGFQSYFQRSGLRFAFSLPGLRLLPTGLREDLRERLRTFYYGAQGVTDEALTVLAEQGGGEYPLFLYVHYMDPHNPYYAHEHLPADPPGALAANSAAAMTAVRADPGDRPTAAQMRFFKHRYANEIRYTDEHIGRLLEAWQQRYGDESLVMITSDHGEEFGDHGGLGHGGSMYRELVSVPLLWRMPVSASGEHVAPRVLHHPVGQVDILPTVLAVVGVSTEVGAAGVTMEGESWLPWIEGEAEAPQRAVFGTQNRQGKRIYRYREGDYVLLRTEPHGGETRVALFSRAVDPDEQKPVTDEPRLKQMEQRFDALHLEMQQLRDAGLQEAVPTQADEEGLRALGYIQ